MVDKTQFALNLINNGAHYFLSGPRRFGKSLFLSTLEEIFKGNKALFEGCHIAQSNYDWQLYPVLYLNLAEVLNINTKYYQLAFPNQEVREAFIKSLVKHFAPLNPQLADEMENLLEHQDLSAFFERIEQIFLEFPYHIFSKVQEHTYHRLLLSLLRGMSLEVYAERANSLGCLDLLIQMPKTTYAIELKLDSSPEAGLKQIISKEYDRPYLGQGKSIARVGLTSLQRNAI